MTEQDIFDKVAEHLLTQKEKAQDSCEVCRYRTANGAKCAVGCLIPDNNYKKTIEGFPTQSVWKEMMVMIPGLQDSHMRLLTTLQIVHDSIPVDKWKLELGNVALKHDLNADVLDKCYD